MTYNSEGRHLRSMLVLILGTVLLVRGRISALDFSVSSSRVNLGTKGTLTFECKVNEKDVDLIYNIQIRRQTDPGKAYRWETLAEIEVSESKVPKLSKDIGNDKNFSVGGLFDVDNPVNTCLNLTMNKEKLTFNDSRDYRCELTYKNKRTGLVLSNWSNVTLVVYDKGEQQAEQQCPECAYRTALIVVSVVLGITISLAIVYATYVTVSKKRRTRKSVGNNLHKEQLEAL